MLATRSVSKYRRWGLVSPKEGKQDVDGRSTNSAGDVLNMQVVRASNNADLWRGVGKSGSVTLNFNATTVADELLAAIRKKAEKYPAAQKSQMTLVLDAGRIPSHTFKTSIRQFSFPAS